MSNASYILKIVILFSLLCLGTASIAQQLKPARVFNDHMVLQREKTVPVWGTGTPGEQVTVSFAGQVKSSKISEDGKWMIRLDPLEASVVGRDLVISGGSEVVISDVLVGEVWICSGQSNMQFAVSNAPEVRGLIPYAQNIRSFEVENTVALEEQEEVSGQWRATHPSSAVAFSFAYFLHDLADVPVGIIQTSWGSSSIEAWMPRSMTQVTPHFRTIMQEFDSDTATTNQIQEILRKPDGWTKKEDVFLRRQPNILYNAMMHPLIPFACRGLVWYQGERHTNYLSGMPEVDESNWFHRVCGMAEYGDVLQSWVQTYRKRWKDDQMHFMVVMLPGFGRGVEGHKKIDPESPTEPSWAWMRESQSAVLQLPHTSFINTIDLGDVADIHPDDKLPIGQRGALLAAKNSLGLDLPTQGPVMEKVDTERGRLIVHFRNTDELKTTNGEAPTGFWITDASKNWVKAQASIEGNRVILTSPDMKQPKYVRYAFAGKPSVNLVNEASLPAYPFRTDNWSHGR
ncbi:sialate O-acetylesterase [Pontibacter sp. E15-1]|uniref:sialate O-acetylesterase n=1 Tax=Pontibacter sp. E15-1 TaxID=2919918 RepID=UPI001F4F53AE|nr:sialate O-acetylesterase [Pontibacter sp. E15-1]MCJ8165739.1 sialate O-acetylesterase [Pontibacter sp. E15-1]